MIKRPWVGSVLGLMSAFTIAAAAQGGGKPLTGNPTPGTSQPESPNLADRITLTGCVQRAPTTDAGSAAAATDPNEPSVSRFVLRNATRQDAVPAGTGGSALANSPPNRTYRLDAIESQLSPFVDTKVEISGEIEPPSSSAPGGANAGGPVLRVEFVQKIAATCS